MHRRVSLLVKLPLPKEKSPAPAPVLTPAPPSLRSTSRPAPSVPVSTGRSAGTITCHFTQSELVLALAIQQSKPWELSTNDYIQRLKEHIKIRQRDSPDQQRHIDSAEFWKEQCNKVLLEKKQLEDKVRCLEETNRRLQKSVPTSPTDSGFAENDNISVCPSEDMAEDLDRPVIVQPRKRRAQAHESAISEELGGPKIDPQFADDEMLRLNSYSLQIKRQRAGLESACKDSNTLLQIDSIVLHINQTIALLEASLPDCFKPFKYLKENSSEVRILELLQRITNQIGLSFFSCFLAFNELCRTIPGRSKKSELVFRMVMFFNNALKFLRTICSLQDESATAQQNHQSRHKRQKVEEKEFAINKYLTKMLVSIAYGLEWKVNQHGHGDLLEGILFLLLEHTGRLVSESVFGEHVAASENPGNITTNTIATRKEVVGSEARYVVQILHAALGASDRKDLVATVLAAPKSNDGASSTRSGDLALLSKVKKLLQSTLVRNTVGGEDLETLRLPTPPLERTRLPNGKGLQVERYGPDWLVETVWALIGWDLMK